MRIGNWLENCTPPQIVVNGISSDQREVSNGGASGMVLGLVLFIVFINDPDEEVEELLITFADDNKLGGVVNILHGRDRIQ